MKGKRIVEGSIYWWGSIRYVLLHAKRHNLFYLCAIFSNNYQPPYSLESYMVKEKLLNSMGERK